MNFVIPGNPIAQKRPRLGRNGVYNPNHTDKLKMKWMIQAQMKEKGYLKVQEAAISVVGRSYHPFPKGTSKKALKTLEGAWHVKKPDVDNIVKFVLDVLAGIAFTDDNQVANIWFEKRLSCNPRVEVSVFPLEDNLINEHALTVKKEISVADLDYMIKKAHRIGKQGRNLFRVYSQEDEEGRHFYFEVGCLREKVQQKV